MCINYAVFIRRLRHPRRPSTKCPQDKMVGDEVSPRRNGWRRSVPATKWLATNCTRDETAGDELSLRQNGRRRNGGDEMAVAKWRRRKGVYPAVDVFAQLHTRKLELK